MHPSSNQQDNQLNSNMHLARQREQSNKYKLTGSQERLLATNSLSAKIVQPAVRKLNTQTSYDKIKY
jgi:hypothetical protein